MNLILEGIRHAYREAAMADGGDAGSAAPLQPAAKAPVHDRIKAFLFSDDGGEEGGEPSDSGDDDTAEAAPQPQAKEAPKQPLKAKQEPEAEPQDDTNDIDFTSVTELAERTGLPLDRILDLSVPAKIDGKEAKATIRELLKSYQLDGVLNSKLSTHAAEVQTWKQQQAEAVAAHQQNMQRLDAGLQVAQRALQGEFNQIDWDSLQQQDPAQFAQTLLGFQQRQAQLAQIADQIGAERAQEQQRQQQQHQQWLAEQKTMLEAKIPEWADEKVRKAQIAEIHEHVGPAYGFTNEELGGISDSRFIIAMNDLAKWQKLQKSKADVMNKVRAAPPLLKPGAAKSASASQAEGLTAAKAQLRKSGHVRDAAKALKAMGIV